MQGSQGASSQGLKRIARLAIDKIADESNIRGALSQGAQP
jgi:hypothetical protein